MTQPVKIHLFARFREVFGSDTIHLLLPPEATVADIREQISRLNPGLVPLLGHSQVAVNSELAIDTAIVHPGDEIALLPPVSGG